jgi:molybdopterin synthase sulfur carrier subunit
MSSRAVLVELFGLPRLLAGRRAVAVKAGTLAEVAAGLAGACPALRGPVLDRDDWLNHGCTFVVDGCFTRNRRRVVVPGSAVLLVASQAGG